MNYKVFQDWKLLGLKADRINELLKKAAGVIDKHNENARNTTTQLTVKPVSKGHFEVVWSYRNTGKRPSGIIETSISWDARLGSAAGNNTDGEDVPVYVRSDSVKTKGNTFSNDIGLNTSNSDLSEGPLVFKFEQVQPGEVVSASFLLFQFDIMGHPSNTVANEVPPGSGKFTPGLSVRVIATGTAPPHTLQQSARAKPWQYH